MSNCKKINEIIDRFIDKLILPSSPQMPLWNREAVIFGKPPRWNYIDGCMIRSLLMLYEKRRDERLLNFAISFTDFFVTENGDIPTFDPSAYNLDSINGCKNLLTLHRLTGKQKYLTAAKRSFADQLETHPRLRCGSFTHKAVYPNQIWLDGAYMALPFMAEFACISGNSDIERDVCMQLENIHSIMRDPVSGLYYHGYNETREQLWADNETGLSREFWLRSIGWLCAALADIWSIQGIGDELRGVCGDMLSDLLDALIPLTSSDQMLLQLPLKPDIKGNYPETSGTLLVAYSALRYGNYEFGERLLDAVCNGFVSLESDMPELRNICLTAGLGGAENRDGSAEYYLGERIVTNDAKGIAPLFMVASQLG